MPDTVIKAILSKVGVVDHDGDIIMAGAFDDAIKAKETPNMLMMHMRASIVGQWSQLRMDGDLFKADKGVLYTGDDGFELARMVRKLIDTSQLKGVSIGFIPRKWSTVHEDGRGRWSYGWDIEKLDLVEASLVDRPANDAATVLDMKQKIDKQESGPIPLMHKFFECVIEVVPFEDQSAELAELARKEAEIVAALRGV